MSTSPSSAPSARTSTRPLPRSGSSARKKAAPTTPAPAGCGPSTPSTAPPTTPTASRCAPRPSPCSATAAPSWASSTPRSWPSASTPPKAQARGPATAAWPPAPPPQLREAIVAIGDYATGPGAARKNETQLAATVSLTPRVHRIRMLGTAALDLAWLAAGPPRRQHHLQQQPLGHGRRDHPRPRGRRRRHRRRRYLAHFQLGRHHRRRARPHPPAHPTHPGSSDKRDPRRRGSASRQLGKRRPRRDPQPRPVPHLRLRRTRP